MYLLLGDTGMSEYKDSVVKKLEPDNLKKIKDWNKKFTEKYSDSDISMLVSLSETIDQLWEETIQLRKQVEEATSDSYSVYGHDVESRQRTTIREKDTIYHKIYKSEHMNNAGPYARLKAAMDYWCALWFWPIDKADLLPTRQEFFFDMNLILDGTYSTVKTTTSVGQMTLIQDEKGNVTFGMEGTQLELEAERLYAGKGEVNLDALRSGEDDRSQRLRIVNEIAEQQKFLHWELEFADVFEENGGFDLVIGNPPWIKYKWDEMNVLSDLEPGFVIKDYSAAIIKSRRDIVLSESSNREVYLNEYNSAAGVLSFLNSLQNYSLLSGVQTNLYKCFLPISWYIGSEGGVSAFVHPDGVFDDSNGGKLREEIYKRFKYHFHFINEKLLFAEVGHPEVFSLNVYCNRLDGKLNIICNLFDPSSIDICFEGGKNEDVGGIKNEAGEWNIDGHQDRIIEIGEEERAVFGELYDNTKDGKQARLPVVHCKQLMGVLAKMARQSALNSICNEYFTTQCFDETGSQNAHIITETGQFTESTLGFIYSGPHIGVANPIAQTPRREALTKGDFDRIDLEFIDDEYLQRSKYSMGCDVFEFRKNTPSTPWDSEYIDNYKLVSRKMLNLKQERTLISAVAPKGSTHINGIFGICFKDSKWLMIMASTMASIPFDFFIKSMGKTNLLDNNAGQLPLVKGKYNKAIMLRGCLLNLLTKNYSDLWSELFDPLFIKEQWAKKDTRLCNQRFAYLDMKWNHDTPERNDFCRRELLVELDVLVAMAMGLTLDELRVMYKIQFPVLQSYEDDTWYDQNGRIVFTNNRSMTGVGFSRPKWEKIKDAKEGIFEQTIEDDTMPGGPVTRTIEYVAPFDKCDREKDYEEVWHNFEARFAK